MYTREKLLGYGIKVNKMSWCFFLIARVNIKFYFFFTSKLYHVRHNVFQSLITVAECQTKLLSRETFKHITGKSRTSLFIPDDQDHTLCNLFILANTKLSNYSSPVISVYWEHSWRCNLLCTSLWFMNWKWIHKHNLDGFAEK